MKEQGALGESARKPTALAAANPRRITACGFFALIAFATLLASCFVPNVPCGTVTDVHMDGNVCHCLVTACQNDTKIELHVNCPCSTNVGDTLLAQ